MIRSAIVEDDKNSQERIRGYMERYCTEHHVSVSINVYEDGLDIAEDYSGQFDLIFCDIQMKFMNGLDAARKIREMDANVIIIFITNLPEYAVQGYEVEAIGYLLKPMNYNSFSMYLGRAIKILESRENDYLVLNHKNGIRRIELSDIYYMDYSKHYMNIYTKYGCEKVMISVKEIEKLLEGKSFSKCNSGCIVNLKYVRNINGNTVKVREQIITISRSRKNTFMKELTDYLGGEGA